MHRSVVGLRHGRRREDDHSGNTEAFVICDKSDQAPKLVSATLRKLDDHEINFSAAGASHVFWFGGCATSPPFEEVGPTVVLEVAFDSKQGVGSLL